jgi:acyl carrier protein
MAEVDREIVVERVTEIWESLLDQRRPRATDSFVGLGGTSLLAIQVVAHVHENFGVELPFTMLFDAPSLARFVDVVVAELEPNRGV